MSILEWIILGIILVVGIVACVVMERIKKQAHGQLPGSMCAGCPNTATVDRRAEKPRSAIREHEHPDIML